MKSARTSASRAIRRLPLYLCLLLLSLATNARAQETDPDDVVRISTELVQTDVTVLDKDGHFVDGLKPEQFELSVDGKRQTISFFERVTAGTASEEAQLAAARGTRAARELPAGVIPLDRGRTVIFFVDDMHMAQDSLLRAKKTISLFIEREMKQNDQLAIISSIGQVGFLQQVTNNKTVLRTAIERLKMSKQNQRDMERPPMSEGHALAIQVQNNRDVLQFFMEPLLQQGMSAEVAENIVRGRARSVLQQSYNLTRSTLATLEGLARSTSRMPGRKLLFFISDGFLINTDEADMLDRLRKITNAAARNGVVIYTLDARGLSVGSVADVSEQAIFDPSGRVKQTSFGDVSASQEPLRILAANTGGRALLNTNSLTSGVSKALQETSVYYLLAWRPLSEAQSNNKFRRIEVKVTGRPDLNVQVRRGYYDLEIKPAPKTVKASAPADDAKIADAEVRDALKSPYPLTALPTRLTAVYMNTPDKGMMLTTSAQIARQFLTFNQAEGKQLALVNIVSLVLDDQGKAVASVKDLLQLTATTTTTQGSGAKPTQDLVYTFQTPLKPGLYQIRIGARDNNSKRTGSDMQWVEIPDLAQGKLTLSSLLLSETTKAAEAANAEPSQIAQSVYSVNRRFARSSKLRFLVFIYNAARAAAASGGNSLPDVALQLQVLRDDQPVLTTTLRKVDTANGQDVARLPYVAELPLEGFPPGRYIMQVTVIDRVARTSASQRTEFDVE